MKGKEELGISQAILWKQWWNSPWFQGNPISVPRASFYQISCWSSSWKVQGLRGLWVVQNPWLRLVDFFVFVKWRAFLSHFGSPYLLGLFKLPLSLLCITDSSLLRHQRRSQRNSSAAGQQGSSAAAFHKNMSCQQRNCGTLGSTMLEGYCQNCFIKAQSQRFQEARRTEEQLVRQPEVSMKFENLG